MEDIFAKVASDLEKSGYRLMFGGRKNGVTERLCFCSLKGASLNVAIIINGDAVSDAEVCYAEICRKALNAFKGGARAVCLGILIGGDSPAFLAANDFDPMAEVVKIRWAYNNGVLTCAEGVPDRLDGIENIFEREKEPLKAVSSASPIKEKKPMITYALIAANLFVFALLTLDGGSKSTETLLKYGAIYAPLIKQGELYRLLCYMFLHIGAIHLFSNMFALYIFGIRCEKCFGYIRFALVYLLSGLGCAALSIAFSGDTVSAGASGAVMGIMGAALSYSYINKIKMEGLDTYTFILIALLNIGFGFVYKDIDNAGHIGGFLTGLVSGAVLGLYDKKKVLKNESSL